MCFPSASWQKEIPDPCVGIDLFTLRGTGPSEFDLDAFLSLGIEQRKKALMAPFFNLSIKPFTLYSKTKTEEVNSAPDSL